MPSAEYMREYRKHNPDYNRRMGRRKRARNRALTRLADHHPGEYYDLYHEELSRTETR